MRRFATALSLALVLTASLAAAAPPADVVRIHLLWTNDLHGHIAPEPARFMNPAFPPPLGGAASAAAYIKRIRAEAAAAGEPVLLVDVGDMFQGTPIGNTTEGAAVVEYFNAIGYDFAVPGNHDFDLGRDVTERLARQSRFPWLSANVVDASTSEVVDWLRPTLMLDLAGVKIGVIGITTPATARMSFPENIAGLAFQPMPETIVRHRDELRAQGADLIFLAIHEGLPYDPQKGWEEIAGRQAAAAAGTEDGGADIVQDQPVTYGANASYGGMNLMELVNEVPGIDFAVGGHTHRGYEEPWIDPVNHTLCFESFGNGLLEKEKQARTVEVEVKLTDPNDIKDLLPGYSADIEILLAARQQALKVPAEAVLENNRVLLMQADGLLVERTFQPGLSNWNTVEVLSGLNVGDKVVLSVGRDGVVAGAYAREQK